MNLYKFLLLGVVATCCSFSAQNELDKNSLIASTIAIEDKIANIIVEIKADKDIQEKTALFEIIFSILEQNSTVSDSIKGIIYHEFGHFQYLQYKDLEAMEAYEKGLTFRKLTLSENDENLARSFYMAGITAWYLGYLDIAERRIINALNIFQARQLEKDILDCQTNLAVIMEDKGDYLKALEYYEEIESIVPNNSAANKKKRSYIYQNMGLLHNKLGNYPIALQFINQSMQFLQKQPIKYKNEIANRYSNLGYVYYNQGNLEKALTAYKKVLKLKRKYLGKENVEVSGMNEKIGLIYLDKGAIDLAEKYFKETYRINSILFKNQKNDKFWHSYHNLSALHFAKKDYLSAIEFAHKALQQSIYSYNDKDVYKNPNWNDTDFIGTKSKALQDLELKAKAFYEWYKSSNDFIHLQTAHQTYQRAIELIDLMRAEFSAKESKEFWLKKTFPIFEKSIQVAIELYHQTRNPNYTKQILQIMERNKAILLLEVLNTSEDNLFTNIPDSLLVYQKDLIAEISELERNLIDLKQKEISKDSLLQVAEHQLTNRKIKLFELEAIFKKKYPNYYQLVKQIEVVTLEGIQNYLSNNQALIEYFYGDSTLYVSTVTKNEIQIHQTPIANLTEQITVFRAGLNTSKTNMNSLQEQGYSLYQKLLKTPINNLPETINELIIIRDRDLFALPFEILANQENKAAQTWTTFPYLQKDFAISYALSATLFLNKQQKKTNTFTQDFIGFAPQFKGNSSPLASRSCNIDSLSSLEFNESEVENITQLMGGQVFSGTQANKANFLEQIKNAQIFHLATHACVDDENPNQSRIYFTEDYFYLHELYNLETNVEMVVLSACETGLGEYQYGEGMMSLSHGFNYAGVPSITMSLWSVNDESTAELMEYYYQHLKEGQPKHQALRQAKLTYLTNQESIEKLHPYYWAGFVHVGDFRPIFPTHLIYPNTYIFLTTLGLLVICFFFFKKNKKN